MENFIEGGTAIATGFFAFVKASTAQWENVAPYNTPGGLHYPYTVFGKHRIEDALGGVIGGDNVRKLDSSYDGAATPKISVLGPLNKVTFAGVGVLIADMVAREYLPEYKKLDGIPGAIKGLGIGLAVGGAIGGLFDPPVQGFTATRPANLVTGGSSSVGSTGVAVGNVPFTRGDSGQNLSVLM